MTTNTRGRIVPVLLLSGGTGSPLWLLSRETCPKQLLSLIGEDDTVRVQDIYHRV
jgi:mannose-1-phosphate guanylyltransferase